MRLSPTPATRSPFPVPRSPEDGERGTRDGERKTAVVLFALAVFGLALGPRWVARDTYVTADEDNWMRRAGGFAWGVANGRPGRTYQNGHPGVLTMELAILGQGPGGAERFADPVTGNPRLVTAVPGFFDGLVEARRAFALATAGMVAGLSLLAWRLFGPGPALVAGVLLALDPFFLAHSQLVHLDALLSGCMSLAVLCGLIRWGGDGSRRWVVLGGVFSGLALLAKMPAVFLGLGVPLLAVALGRRRGARALSTDLGLWAAAGLAACVVLWPSLWVNPLSTVARMMDFARETGGQPHEQGSFFLGQTVVDPGPLFYAVAVPLRLSPAATLGLAALALIAWRARRNLSPEHSRAALALLGYALGFGLFMTLAPKKFDRYLLPAFPILDLLAGLGLWLAWRPAWGSVGPAKHPFVPPGATGWAAPPCATAGFRLSSRLPLLRGLLLPLSLPSALPLAIVLAAWPLLSVFPHYLAYYNPLLGGGATAVKAIPVGEGEGLAEVARWLNAQPGAGGLSVVSDSFDVLHATFVGSGETLRDRVPASADYVVLYNYQTQIGHSPHVVAEYGQRAPAFSVRLNGIDYARVYRGPHRPAADGEGASGR